MVDVQCPKIPTVRRFAATDSTLSVAQRIVYTPFDLQNPKTHRRLPTPPAASPWKHSDVPIVAKVTPQKKGAREQVFFPNGYISGWLDVLVLVLVFVLVFFLTSSET